MIMFCSKCGNQVKDDALFCSKCGYDLSGAHPDDQESNPFRRASQSVDSYAPRQGYTHIDPEEDGKKKSAIAFYVASGIMMLGGILAVAVSNFKILADLIDSSDYKSTIERVIQEVSDEFSGFITIFAFAYIVYFLIQSITLWKQYQKREFSENRGAVKANCVCDIIIMLLATLLIKLFIFDKAEGDIHFSAVYYFILITISAFKIIYVILYCKAADIETYKKFKESSRSPLNQIDSSYNGKRSGKKTISENVEISENGWLCKTCNTVNEKNAMVCKGCGKYK